MIQNPKRIYGGLLKTPKEQQKFSFGGVFGYIPFKDLPKSYRVGTPLEIKNQGTLFTCVAYATTAVSEYQEGCILNPAFTIKTISKLLNDTSWVFKGTSLDIGAKAAKEGFLSPLESPTSVLNTEVEYYANPANWPSLYSDLALKHAKKDWFWIGVHGNMFESICSALWQFRNEKRAVLTGLIWDNEWTNLTFIDNEGTNAGGHSIAIIGYEKQLNGKDYLVIQNSIGKEIGDEGIQYLSRDLINRNLQFGALMFVDAEDITEEQILKKSAYYRANFLKKLYLLFIKWLFAE